MELQLVQSKKSSEMILVVFVGSFSKMLKIDLVLVLIIE